MWDNKTTKKECGLQKSENGSYPPFIGKLGK
jgi:hypothetical protein